MPLGQAVSPILQQAEQALQAKVPQQYQDALARVVKAGLSILYSPQLRAKLQQRISQGGNVVKDASDGAVRMIFELYKQSNKSIPAPVMVPAAMMFAFEYMDLVAKAGKVPITSNTVAQVTQATGQAMMTALGVTPQKLQQMAAQHQPGAQQGAPSQPQPAGLIGGQMQGAR